MCPSSSSWGSPSSQSSRACFALFLTTVLRKLLIILLIRLHPHLYTMIYFFISHLALMGISFSSVIVCKMVMDMQIQDQSIPYAGCVTQMYCFHIFCSH